MDPPASICLFLFAIFNWISLKVQKNIWGRSFTFTPSHTPVTTWLCKKMIKLQEAYNSCQDLFWLILVWKSQNLYHKTKNKQEFIDTGFYKVE